MLLPSPGDKNFREAKGEIVDRSIVRSFPPPRNNYSSPPTSRASLSRRKRSNGRGKEGKRRETTRRGSRGIYDDLRVSNSNSKPVSLSAWANERLYWPIRRMTFADTLAVGRRKIVDWLAPLRSNENVLFENYNLNKRG